MITRITIPPAKAAELRAAFREAYHGNPEAFHALIRRMLVSEDPVECDTAKRLARGLGIDPAFVGLTAADLADLEEPAPDVLIPMEVAVAAALMHPDGSSVVEVTPFATEDQGPPV